MVVLGAILLGVWGKLGQSFFRCPGRRHLRQSFSLMQRSRSSGVILGIVGRGSVGFQDVAMVRDLCEGLSGLLLEYSDKFFVFVGREEIG